MSTFNPGSMPPIAGYSTSYVDSRQVPWQHGVADYGARQPMMSSMLSHSRIPTISAYGSSYGSVSSSPMGDTGSSFRGGRMSASLVVHQSATLAYCGAMDSLSCLVGVSKRQPVLAAYVCWFRRGCFSPGSLKNPFQLPVFSCWCFEVVVAVCVKCKCK